MKKHKSKSELKPNKSNNLKFLVFWEKNIFFVYHKTKMIYVQVTHRAEMNISTIRTMLQSVSWWRLLQRRKNAQIPKIYRCWLFWALASFGFALMLGVLWLFQAYLGYFFIFVFLCDNFSFCQGERLLVLKFTLFHVWTLGGGDCIVIIVQAGGPAAHQEDNPD